MWGNFVRSPLTIAVDLRNCTPFHRKIMHEICGEKKTTFHLLSYTFLRFFSNREACDSPTPFWRHLSICEGQYVEFDPHPYPRSTSSLSPISSLHIVAPATPELPGSRCRRLKSQKDVRFAVNLYKSVKFAFNAMNAVKKNF